MNPESVDWTADVETTPEQEYRALLRSLRRTRNFGLFFVQCSPAQGEQLIQRLQEDLPQKRTEVLSLKEPIDNLYDVVNALPDKDQIDILFIQGIERSLYEYEQDRLWNDSSERYGYSESGVPPLLAHLNLSRERFRDRFKTCFVFLVPLFALKYLMRRAPDFFDWRSGVLEFVADSEVVATESFRIVVEGAYQKYLTWTQQERNQKILEIQALLEETHQTADRQSQLLFEQANLFEASGNFEVAIASYNKAIEFKPNLHEAWINRGVALSALGRKEDAIASYDQAITLKPDDYEAWYNRGNALSALGRQEEAITSYDQAIELKLDYHQAWYNRSFVMSALGRHEEAITSYDQAIELKPHDHYAWYNKARCCAQWGRAETAIKNLKRAIELNPECWEWAKTDKDFDEMREDKGFRMLIEGVGIEQTLRQGEVLR